MRSSGPELSKGRWPGSRHSRGGGPSRPQGEGSLSTAGVLRRALFVRGVPGTAVGVVVGPGQAVGGELVACPGDGHVGESGLGQAQRPWDGFAVEVYVIGGCRYEVGSGGVVPQVGLRQSASPAPPVGSPRWPPPQGGPRHADAGQAGLPCPASSTTRAPRRPVPPSQRRSSPAPRMEARGRRPAFPGARHPDPTRIPAAPSPTGALVPRFAELGGNQVVTPWGPETPSCPGSISWSLVRVCR